MRFKPTRRPTVRHTGAGSAVRQPRPEAPASASGAGPRGSLLDRLGPGVMESLESRLHMSVSKDPNGFTIVTPAGDSRVIYVSAAGNDAADGRSVSTPVKTIARARDLVGAGAGQVGTGAFRTNVADQILLRRGDTFTGRFEKWATSGRSASEPFVIGAYTDAASPSTARPKVHTGRSTGFANHTQSGTVSHVYILGVAFEADQRDYREKPAGFSTGYLEDVQGGTYGINVYGSVNNLYVEDASFQYYRGGIVAQEAGGYARPANITVRRSQLVDNYAQSFTASGAYVTSEGIFAQGVNGLALLENVFDRNGWSDPAYGNLGSFPTIYNHNAYIHTSNDNFSAIGNTFSNAASHGLQARAGGIVRNNLFVNNPIAMSFGYVNGIERDGGVSGEISGNVVYGSRDINGQQRGWGIELGNLKRASNGGGTVVRNNVFTSYGAQGQPVMQVSFGTNAQFPQYGVGINDLTIQNNIVHGWTRGIYINPGLTPGGTNRYGLNNLTVRNNEFQQVYSTPIIDHGPSFSASAETWIGNRYDLLNAGTDSTNYFRVKGANYTLNQWRAQVEPTATTARLTYPNPNVSPASYNQSIGGANSIDAFMDQARRQSSRFWRSQYTTAAVLNYMSAGFAGQRVDSFAPSAQSAPSNVTAGGGATHTFVVLWTDDNQVNLASIGNGDVTVTGPGGYSQAASLVSAVRNADGSLVTATYSVPAAGGRWSASANGRYTVAVAAGQVTDTKGNATPAGTLATFDVNIAAAAPTATMGNLGPTANPAAAVMMPVTYTAGAGLINRATVDGDDLFVTGPDGYAAIPRFVGANQSANAATIVGTYQLDPPEGGWTSELNGLYYVYVRDAAVTATNGTQIGQAVLGTFTVEVTVPTAVGTGPAITERTTAAQQVTVAYAAAGGINLSTIDSADVRIQGPNGFAAATTYVSRTGGGVPGDPLVVTYQFAAPAGGFNESNDGTYTIVLQPNQVRGNGGGGQAAPAGPVGSFTVKIDTEGPSATAMVPGEFKLSPATTSKLITVVFRDANGVNRSTIGAGDILVQLPDGNTVQPAFKGVTGTGVEVTATYELALPGGITAARAGEYYIYVAGQGVADVSGNTTYEGQYAGEFRMQFDTTAPNVEGYANGDVSDPNQEVELSVSFSDGGPGLDEATLNDATIRVTGPNGFSRPATLISLDVADVMSAYANYRVEPPAGGWHFDQNGTYTIALDGGTLADLSGNVAAATVLGQFKVAVPSPFIATVDPVGAVGPGGLDALTIRFSEEPFGADRGDLSLTRDGGPNLLPGSAAVLTRQDDYLTFKLTGLSALTSANGQYVLTLPTASGVVNYNQQPLFRNLSFAFQVSGTPADTTPPTVAVTAVTPSPRTTPVGSMTVTFSERVTGFDVGDLALTRGGQPVSLAGVALATADGGRTYTVSGLTAATTPVGSYALAVRSAGTGVADAAGNPLSVGASTSFTVTAVTPAATATFVRADGTTGGTWKGVYGAQGAAIAADGSTLPAYAPLTSANAQVHPWDAAPADARAPQRVAAGAGRIASSWYGGTAFDLKLNLTDGQAHQVALYVLDWDAGGARAQRVDVLDAATGAQLASTTAEQFQGGRYLVFDVKGNVTFRVTNTGTPNAVVSGVFLDPVGGTVPPTVPPSPPAGTGPVVDLINAATDTKIATLTNGYVIDMSQTGTRLNIQGLPSGTAGSLSFKIDGQVIRTESYAPYTIGGDSGNDYLDWTPPVGTHTLEVVQYAGANATGAVQGTTTLSFTAVGPQSPPPPPPAGSTVALRAAADAHGINGTTAATNYGTSGELQVRLSSIAGQWREAFLRFDLSQVASADQITAATARLYGRLSQAGSVNVGLFPLTSVAGWTETGLTWNNKPASGTTSIGPVKTLTSTADAWYEFDVTSYLKQQKAAGASFAELAVKATNYTTPHVIFASDEAAANRPELRVVQGGTVPAPVPAIVLSQSTATVAEGQSTAAPTVRLSAQPAGDVAVTVVRQSGDTDLSGAPATFLFTPANWATPQPLTLSAAEDADATNGSAVFALSAPGLSTVTLTATEQDNDTVSPPPPPPVGNGPVLDLLNSVNDSVIAPFTNGYVIDLGQTGTRLNIRATPVGTAGSVVFRLNGQAVSTETYAPYSVGGDSNGGFNDWTPPVGTHTLQVTQYAGTGGTGTVQGTTTVSFTVVAGGPADTTPPTATVAQVTPTPRTTPVESVTFTFSEPVNGFDLSDLTLTRSGGANLLGIEPSLTTTDGRTFTLAGLTSATAASGSYVLTLKSSGTGIVDVAGNPMTTGASTAWSVSAPQAGAPVVSGVSPNPVTGATTSQNLVINGSNFAAAATVTLRNLSTGTVVNATVVARSGTTQITVSNVFGTSAATWTAQVLNGTTASGQFQFAVGAGPAVPAKLSGTAIGTTGSYNNNGNTGAKALDGSLTTYFDAPAASGAWVGLDLGSAKKVTSVKFAPRASWASRMVGGKFQASNSANFSSGVVDLHTVSATPASGTLTTVNVNPAASTYRYVRYLAPSGSYGNVAEVQFFAA